MKKILFLLILISLFSMSSPIKANGELAVNSRSACLIEASTQRIIYEKNPTERRAPASMTKIMTMILVLEALDQGKFTLNDIVTTPEVAVGVEGTTIFLDVNEEMSVEHLLKSVAINSANDAAVALAVFVGGSVDNFVNMMNDKAQELHLENTNFVNPHGLDTPNHYSCSRDMAMMGAYLINKYPKIIEYTSRYEDYVREHDINKRFWLVNTNKLVRFMKGVDGLKTGMTDNAGYCITCTIKKNDVRFISVVMGCQTAKLRTDDTVALLNFACNNYEVHRFLKKDDSVTTFEDVLAKPTRYKVVTSEDINILKKKGESLKPITTKVSIDNLKLKRFDKVVGTLEVYYDGKLYKTVELEIHEDVHRSSFFDVIFEVLKEIFLVS